MSNNLLICGNCRYVEVKPNTNSCNCRFNPPVLIRRFVTLDESGIVKNIEAASVSPNVYAGNTACCKFEVANA